LAVWMTCCPWLVEIILHLVLLLVVLAMLLAAALAPSPAAAYWGRLEPSRRGTRQPSSPGRLESRPPATGELLLALLRSHQSRALHHITLPRVSEIYKQLRGCLVPSSV